MGRCDHVCTQVTSPHQLMTKSTTVLPDDDHQVTSSWQPTMTGCLRFLDSVLSIFVFAPLVVSYWRGTWQLLEIYLLPNKEHVSAWCSLAFGIGVTVVLGLTQTWLEKWLCWSRSKVIFILGSRLYTAVFALAGVNHWRGVWTVLALYTGYDTYSAVASVVVGIGGLLVVRGLRNVVSPPMLLVTDHEKDYYLITTLYNTKANEKPYLFVLDLLFSVVIVASLAILVWRGLWCLLDLHFYPDDDKCSAWGSYILGSTITLFGFVLQRPASRISQKLSFWSRLIFEDIFIFVTSFGTINLWRGVWNVLDLYLFPDEKEMSNWISHGIGLGALIIAFSGNTIISRGADRDAECSDGSGCIFPVSYLQVFIEQYKTEKEEKSLEKRNWKKKDVEMENVNNSTTVKLTKEEHVTESLILESSETFPDGSIGVLRMIDSNSDTTA